MENNSNSRTVTFPVSRKMNGHVFHEQWRVTTSPGELTEAHKSSRWYADFGSEITKVEKVEVLAQYSEGVKTEEEWAEHARHRGGPSKYTVVTTPYGSTCIVDFVNNWSDVCGAIINRPGKRAKALTVGTSRKYGQKRGHGMAWLLAMAGQKRCTSPRSGRDVCPAEAYNRLSEGCWPSRAAIAKGHTPVAL